MALPTSHFFISHRLKLHYLDWGNHNAPCLVLVHGGRDNARSLSFLASQLSRDWHVIALDLRGHGESEHSTDGQYRVEGFIYDLVRLVDNLGERSVSIIAHSLGGVSALAFSGLFPEKVSAIVAIEGLTRRSAINPPPIEDRMREWIEQSHRLSSHKPRSYATLDQVAARMREAYPSISEHDARQMAGHSAQRNEDGTYGWKFDEYSYLRPAYELTSEDYFRLWRAITAPVLLLHGGRSWAPHPEVDGRLAQFRNARVVSFAEAGHWVHYDEPDAVLAHCRVFLAESIKSPRNAQQGA
jgi:pimeloyl-ACP methyl ester carboxylesterase